MGLKPPLIDQWDRAIGNYRREIAITYLLVLAAFYVIYLLSLAIEYSDSDLWYHLAGGRYLLDTGELYNPFVNSYLTPAREFINYFWGFQLLTYSTWLITGEFGLIVVKALLFCVSGYFVARIILGERRPADATVLQLIAITAVIGILCARGFSLRPHVASYAFIPVFIYILGSRPRWYPLLPLLTIAWVNFHGVEWVIGALICGAWFIQHLADFYFSESRDPATLKPTLWLILCLPAMMVSPNHVNVLMTPFVHDPGLNLFISELEPSRLDLTFDLNHGISTNSLVLLTGGLVFTALLVCIRDAKRTIAPILLAAGGIILLLIAKRFMWEWALLSVPLIAAGLQRWPGPSISLRSYPVLLTLIILLPGAFWPTIREGWQHYPYDENSLPYGTTRFIQDKGITGRYAIAPSYAGYTEFILSPSVRVHMDMQFPPFTSGDFHEISTALLSDSGFRTYVRRYRPDLVGVMKSSDFFPRDAATAEDYVPVFFDNKVVLYLDSRKYPDLAKTFALQTINPFVEGEIRRDDIDKGIMELERMLSVVDTPDVKLTLVGLLMEQRELARARVYTEELMQENPYNVATIYSHARVAHLSDDCETAVTAYEDAIPLTDDPLLMHRYAAECYFILGDQSAAYRHFALAINPYRDPAPDILNYYQYAISAIGAGHPDHARRLLTMIEQTNPDSPLKDQVAAIKADLAE